MAQGTVVTYAAGRDGYLQTHEGITHTALARELAGLMGYTHRGARLAHLRGRRPPRARARAQSLPGLDAQRGARRPGGADARLPPALYKDEGFERPKRQLNEDPDLHAFRRRPVPPEDNLALQCCTRFEGDVLLVESEHDTVIPHQVLANYLNAFQRVRSRLHHLLRDADHALGNPAHRREYEHVLYEWFKDRFAECTPGNMR